MKKIKTILITSGGTREDIDDIRFITNVSSGKLGAKVAEEAIEKSNFRIIYIHTENSIRPCNLHLRPIRRARIKNGVILNGLSKELLELPQISDFIDITVRSTNDAHLAMEFLVPKADAVIHAMACGDFSFEGDSKKLKSNDPSAFVDSLKERIVINRKILKSIKKWNPETFLVSFKFETGLSFEQLEVACALSMVSGASDVVVGNDKWEMEKANSHVAHFFFAKDATKNFKTKNKYDTAISIYNILDKSLNT